MKKINILLLKYFCLMIGILFWCGSAFAQPANDLCGAAVTLNCGDTGITGTNIGATADDLPGGCFSLSEGVWYVFAGTGDEITVTVAPIGWDPEINVSSGTCGALTNISCTDTGGSGTAETATFQTVIGTDYYIYVADWNGTIAPGGTNEGDFTITVVCGAIPPPTNDVCATAVDYTATFGPIGATGTCPGNAPVSYTHLTLPTKA